MSESTRTCDAERLEQYVAGRLDEVTRDAVEQHVLECEACAEDVQLLAALRAGLSTSRASFIPWISAVAAVAVLAIGAGIVRNQRGSVPLPASPPAAREPVAVQPDLDALASFTPPPYLSLRTRAAESPTDRAFDAAMESYNAGRYDRAADLLAEVVKRSPDHEAASLFFGISLLAGGRPADAVEPLTRVIERDGTHTGLARLMLARAHLRRKDVAAARRELETVTAGADPEASQARALLKALPAR